MIYWKVSKEKAASIRAMIDGKVSPARKRDKLGRFCK
jgi:hypothetical protein